MTKRHFLFAALGALLLAGSAFAKEDGRFEQTLEVGSPVEIEVRTDAGGITVRSGADGEVRVVGVIRRSRGPWRAAGMDKVRAVEQNPPIRREGSLVRIGHAVPGADLKGLSISYEIWTPRDTRLTSECDSGGQTIEGINGPVNAKCDSGGIRVRDVRGDVSLSVDSGRIEVDGVDGSLTAQSDSGGIDAKSLRGPVDLSVDSGGIRIEQLAAADIRAEADSGGIRVRVPAGAGYDLNAETDSGGIEIEPEMTVKGVWRKDRAEGKIAGGGNLMQLKTDSGGIRVYHGAGEI